MPSSSVRKPARAFTGPRNDFDLPVLADRMTLPAINEAIACVREGIVADADLADAGVIFGTGFAPHRGGPIQAARSRGKDELLKIMADFEKHYGERFKPDAGWQTVL